MSAHHPIQPDDRSTIASAAADGDRLARRNDWLVNDTVRLARSLNHIATRYRHEAAKYEASGNLKLYRVCLLDEREYRRRAKQHLEFARMVAQ